MRRLLSAAWSFFRFHYVKRNTWGRENPEVLPPEKKPKLYTQSELFQMYKDRQKARFAELDM